MTQLAERVMRNEANRQRDIKKACRPTKLTDADRYAICTSALSVPEIAALFNTSTQWVYQLRVAYRRKQDLHSSTSKSTVDNPQSPRIVDGNVHDIH